MSKDKLIVFEDQGVYVIAWYLAVDQDIGAYLGDDERPEISDIASADPVDRGHRAATLAAYEVGTERRKHVGFVWETETEARAALRYIKARMASLLSNVPWPEWAVMAKAEGWRAPKGWKP